MSLAFGFEDLDRESLNNVKLRGGIVVTTEEELRTHVVAALNTKEQKSLYMGALSEQTKKQIETDVGEAIFKKPGQYTYSVSYDDIRHIRKHYASVDEIVETAKQLFAMLKSYDNIKTETLKDGQTRLVAEKRLPNAEYLTVNIVSNKRRTLDLTTIYITKKANNNGSQTTRPASSKALAGAQSGSTPTTGSIPDAAAKSNPQNAEGKTSQASDSLEGLRQENEELRGKVKEFEKALKAREKQLAATRESRDNWRNKASFRPESVGREIIRAYEGTIKESEIHDEVKALIDTAAKKTGVTFEQLQELAMPAAKKIVESARAAANGVVGSVTWPRPPADRETPPGGSPPCICQANTCRANEERRPKTEE